MLQALEHAIRHDFGGNIDRQFHDRLEQFGLRVFDHDALHPRQQEHAAVVPRVSGDQHLLERNLDATTKPREGVALVGAAGQDVEVTQARIHDRHQQSGRRETRLQFGDLLAAGTVQEPARLVGVKKLGRLALDARRDADDLLHLLEVPAFAELRDEVRVLLRLPHIDELGAHAADDVIGRRELAGRNEAAGILQRAPAVVGQQRAGLAREAGPGLLETPRGFGIPEQGAVEVGGEESDEGGGGRRHDSWNREPNVEARERRDVRPKSDLPGERE